MTTALTTQAQQTPSINNKGKEYLKINKKINKEQAVEQIIQYLRKYYLEEQAWSDKDEWLFEIRALKKDGKVKRLIMSIKELKTAPTKLETFISKHYNDYNIYHTIFIFNPSLLEDKNKRLTIEKSIKQSRVVFIDVDKEGHKIMTDEEIEETIKEVTEKLEKILEVKINVGAIYSGRGVHIKLLLNDYLNEEEYTKIPDLLTNAEIIADNIYDFARIIRIPYTINQNSGKIAKVIKEGSVIDKQYIVNVIKRIEEIKKIKVNTKQEEYFYNIKINKEELSEISREIVEAIKPYYKVSTRQRLLLYSLSVVFVNTELDKETLTALFDEVYTRLVKEGLDEERERRIRKTIVDELWKDRDKKRKKGGIATTALFFTTKKSGNIDEDRFLTRFAEINNLSVEEAIKVIYSIRNKILDTLKKHSIVFEKFKVPEQTDEQTEQQQVEEERQETKESKEDKEQTEEGDFITLKKLKKLYELKDVNYDIVPKDIKYYIPIEQKTKMGRFIARKTIQESVKKLKTLEVWSKGAFVITYDLKGYFKKQLGDKEIVKVWEWAKTQTVYEGYIDLLEVAYDKDREIYTFTVRYKNKTYRHLTVGDLAKTLRLEGNTSDRNIKQYLSQVLYMLQDVKKLQEKELSSKFEVWWDSVEEKYKMVDEVDNILFTEQRIKKNLTVKETVQLIMVLNEINSDLHLWLLTGSIISSAFNKENEVRPLVWLYGEKGLGKSTLSKIVNKAFSLRMNTAESFRTPARVRELLHIGTVIVTVDDVDELNPEFYSFIKGATTGEKVSIKLTSEGKKEMFEVLSSVLVTSNNIFTTTDEALLVRVLNVRVEEQTFKSKEGALSVRSLTEGWAYPIINKLIDTLNKHNKRFIDLVDDEVIRLTELVERGLGMESGKDIDNRRIRIYAQIHTGVQAFKAWLEEKVTELEESNETGAEDMRIAYELIDRFNSFEEKITEFIKELEEASNDVGEPILTVDEMIDVIKNSRFIYKTEDKSQVWLTRNNVKELRIRYPEFFSEVKTLKQLERIINSYYRGCAIYERKRHPETNKLGRFLIINLDYIEKKKMKKEIIEGKDELLVEEVYSLLKELKNYQSINFDDFIRTLLSRTTYPEELHKLVADKVKELLLTKFRSNIEVLGTEMSSLLENSEVPVFRVKRI